MPVPNPPQNLSVIRSEDRESFLVSWDAVTEDVVGDPAEVSAYEIYASEVDNGLRYELATTLPAVAGVTRIYATVESVVLPGSASSVPVDPDGLYFFKVAAINYDGRSEFSAQETDF